MATRQELYAEYYAALERARQLREEGRRVTIRRRRNVRINPYGIADVRVRGVEQLFMVLYSVEWQV